jgi:hypothetical protein
MEVGRGGVLLGNRSEMPEDLACPRHGSSVEKDVTTTSPLYSPPPLFFHCMPKCSSTALKRTSDLTRLHASGDKKAKRSRLAAIAMTSHCQCC